jgi:hypothetical protein
MRQDLAHMLVDQQGELTMERYSDKVMLLAMELDLRLWISI